MIKYKIQRKLLNVISLFYLIDLNSNFPFKPEKIKKIQNKKLQKLMKKAYQIPFYRKRFDMVGLKPEDFKTAEDLVKFPTVTKQDLRELIEEETKTKPWIKQYFYPSGSSGSSGIPFIMYYSPLARAVNMANWIRFSMKNGFNPLTGKTLSIDNPQHLAKRDSFLQRFGILQRKCISYLDEASVMVSKYNEYKPDFVYATKTNLYMMALYAEKNNIKLHKPFCFCTIGELVLPQERKFLEEHFGSGYFSSYGCTESGACTFISDKKEYHNICHDTHILNVYNDAGELSNKGKFILTNLTNLDLPVINYNVGDEGEIFLGEDGLTYVKEICGRNNDWFLFEDGTTMNYHQFNVVMQARTDIIQFRFIQEDFHNITAVLVKDKHSNTDNKIIEEEIEAGLKKYIKRTDLNYKFEWVEEIKPDENGKKRIIISKVRR